MEQMRKDPEATDLEVTEMLWPIPQTELDPNPLLTQNPGYWARLPVPPWPG